MRAFAVLARNAQQHRQIRQEDHVVVALDEQIAGLEQLA